MAIGKERRYLSELRGAFEEVINEFRENPASFLMESDLQGLLFAALFKRLRGMAVPATATDKRWNAVQANGRLLTNPARSQYPSYFPPKNKTRRPADSHFDIAVVSQHLIDEHAWHQPMRAAIEIKFWQVIPPYRRWEPDRGKLRRYHAGARNKGRPFTGVCLVFSHKERTSAQWGKIDSVNPDSLSPPENGVIVWGITPGPVRKTVGAVQRKCY